MPHSNKIVKILYFLTAVYLIASVGLTVININKLSELEIIDIQTKRAYYPQSVAALFQNKFIKSFSISQKEIFDYLTIDKLFR